MNLMLQGRTNRTRLNLLTGSAFVSLVLAWRLCAAFPATGQSSSQPQTPDDEAWKIFRPALLQFQHGASLTQVLSTCKGLQRQYPGSRYETELTSLVRAIEREASKPRPDFLDKKPNERTKAETIRYWIYELRDLRGRQFSDPGYPALFAPMGPVGVADQIVALGPEAVPFLIDALDDDTPTRTIAWQRSFYPVYFVLRRQDVAMKCLERIAGCRFYEEGATFIHLYMDKPERREAAISTLKRWWDKSKGQSQATWIRNQMELRGKSADSLQALAMIEGPETVIADLRQLFADSKPDLNNYAEEVLFRLDPQTVLRGVFQRFKEGSSKDGDYKFLLKYGGRTAYEEMTRRLAATGKLDPSGWTFSEQAQWAAKYGQNWAIPVLAELLVFTNADGSRYVNPTIGGQSFANADVAVEEFQKLTGKDFGYRREKELAERQAIIGQAREWWKQEGQKSTAEIVAKDHAPVLPLEDLLFSEDQINGLVSALESREVNLRRRTVASLQGGYSYRVQRALLSALELESAAPERAKIIQVLQKHPALWHLPSLVRVMESDSALTNRILAAQGIKQAVIDTRGWLWSPRLESREQALTSARRLVPDGKTPVELRRAGAEILMAWNSFTDEPLLRTPTADAAFKDFEPLRTFLQRQDEIAKRAATGKEPEE